MHRLSAASSSLHDSSDLGLGTPLDSASVCSSARTSDSGLGLGGHHHHHHQHHLGAGSVAGAAGTILVGQAPGLRRMQFPRPVQIHHVMPEPLPDASGGSGAAGATGNAASSVAAPSRPRTLQHQQQQQQQQHILHVQQPHMGSRFSVDARAMTLVTTAVAQPQQQQQQQPQQQQLQSPRLPASLGMPPPPPSYNSNHAVLSNLAQHCGQTTRNLGACAKCSKEIAGPGEACQALGKIYHSACFVCSCCGRELTGQTFYAVPSATEGSPPTVYCTQDFLYTGFQQAAEKCSACGHMITDQILQALGRPFHPACFRCSVCQSCLDGKPFTVDLTGAVFCVPDYHRVYAPRCHLCRLPITPDSESTEEVLRVVSMGKDFHLACYRCQDCGLQLTNDSHRRCYPIVRSQSDQVSLFCYGCRVNRESC